MGVEVFFSYSHRDEDLRDELEKHLSNLKHQGVIEAWHDRRIDAGSEWAKSIDARLNAAHVILLLVSADFLASQYCYDHEDRYDLELKQALERHQMGEALVIPVILRPVDWQDAPFGKLQPLPKDGKAVTIWENRDEAFLNVAQGIRQTVQYLGEKLEANRQASRTKLYKALLKLGYRQQVRLFRKAVETESIAAFLIHGLPEHGQRWLLNRLAVKYVDCYLNSKRVVVNPGRLVRRTDASALWRELGGQLGVKGLQPSREDIAQKAYQCWLTQDVIFVIHDVNILPEVAVCDLIDNFWLPLSRQVKNAASPSQTRKLLLFLVDYEGEAERWNIPCVEKLDSNWDGQQPIKPPKLREFTDSDLENWLEDHHGDLPSDLTRGIDEKVDEILENSDQGIPELAFREICERCGYDWYEEREKWLNL
ncbi:MAG: toll/interleukin-1 receptor domain-containing protein [Tildeniella torsiva UHER 1998/13D]|jgi:hypothetical protein|nr:toll/interleukin-1 receptor domain-containing protein [Tildeniella torsiva UHER 1998/13D]